MAYMIDGRGPFADKTGEWVRNDGDKCVKYLRNDPPYRVGRPGPGLQCQKTSRILVARGIVGLYLRADKPSPKGAVEIPTPPELMEPPE